MPSAVAGAVDDVQAMAMPAVRPVAGVVAQAQLASGVVDQVALHPLDQFPRQTRAGLTPGRVGKSLAGQMPHRRAGEVALGDLLGEPRAESFGPPK